jgi:hypothetical protein
MVSAVIARESRLGFGVGVAAIFVIGIAYQLANIVNHDAIYYVYAAQKLLAGGDYPDQIYDINPPLIVLLSIPPALLAQYLPLSMPAAFVLYIYALFGASLWMIWTLVPLHFKGAPRLEALGLVGWAVFVLIMPGYNFGQREHILAIVAAPYLCLIARRWNDIASSKSTQITCTSFCAIGLLLKPTFIAIPLAIFLVDIVRERSLRRIYSAENITFVSWALAYTALVWTVFPGYFQIAADGVRTYGYYDNPVLTVGRQSMRILLAGGFCLVAAFLLDARGILRSLLWLCGIVVAVTALHVFLQRKGWSYHFLPAWIALGFICTIVTVLAMQWLREDRSRWPATLLLLACLAAGSLEPLGRTLFFFYRDNNVLTLARQPLFASLRDDMRGNNVMSISSGAGPLGVAAHAGAGWGSRFIAYLDLPFVEDKLMHPAGLSADDAERVKRLDRTLKAATAEDLRTYKPKFIFVEISPAMQGMRSGHLSMLEYFRQDADVERELENYIVYAGSPSGVLTYYHRRFIVLQRQGG